MLLNIFHQSVEELRKPVFTWTLVMLGLACLVLLAYPLLKGFVDLDWLGNQRSASFLFGYDPGQLRFSRLGDWLHAVGFGLLFPLLLAGYACVLGSWLVAGEEERGSLGMLLAAPLPRWRFIVEKSAVLLVSVGRPVVALGLLMGVASWFGARVAGLGYLLVGIYLLGVLFGALALALGSASGRRRQSLLISVACLGLAFVLSRLPGAAAWQLLRLASPVYYYEISASRPVFLLALVALVLVCFGLAWVGFERRDLEV